LFLMLGHGQYERIGGTLDDAAGEAFDKVARLLGLGFPGGPAIQRAAAQGDPARFSLPHPLMGHGEHRFNLSFSGLKTAVLNLTRHLQSEGVNPSDSQVAADIAASFQKVVAEVLVSKTVDAAREFGAQQICICGGVSANAELRRLAQATCSEAGIPLYIPPLFLCTDNAAMIGAAAYYRLKYDPHAVGDMGLDVHANLPLVEAP
jgi:N6-L-threonylcarbamoyladenine synthase